MEPPQKKQKLSVEKPRFCPEIRLNILKYLLPDDAMRLAWDACSMKSALLDTSETAAPYIWEYSCRSDTFADEAVKVCNVDSKFEQYGNSIFSTGQVWELNGFGFSSYAGCDIEQVAKDLKGIKEIKLTLPRLQA